MAQCSFCDSELLPWDVSASAHLPPRANVTAFSYMPRNALPEHAFENRRVFGGWRVHCMKDVFVAALRNSAYVHPRDYGNGRKGIHIVQ